MSEKTRILLLTYFPLRDDLSTGNTLINVFEGIENSFEFANIYIKDGKPNNKLVNNYFHISEKKLIKSILTRQPVFSTEEIVNEEANHRNSKAYNKARQLRWDSLLLAQDMSSLLGCWKSKELDKFISDFKPDVVFGPLGRVPLPNVIMKYIHETFKVKTVSFAWDDHYSLNKISYSPFFWLRTFVERHYIKKCTEICDCLFTITKLMKQEYSLIFGKECYVVNKSYDFSGNSKIKNEIPCPVKMVYLGNVGAGRIDTIAKVAESINALNLDENKVELDVYTATPLSKQTKNRVECNKGVSIKKAVPQKEVKRIMNDSDILLYVTPVKEKERLLERLSFSTKLVDYFYATRCIYAVGGETDVMDYLRDNDSAIVITNLENIADSLKRLVNDPNQIKIAALNAWDCGVKNHQCLRSQEMILTLLSKPKETNNE